MNNTFIYPLVAGYSYSFTDDGYYEEASFTWTSNATDHHVSWTSMLEFTLGALRRSVNDN